MKQGGGKAKGSEFERKLCRAISLFWSDGKSDDLCWRSAASGARGTVSRTKTRAYHGDLVSTDPSIDPLFKVFSFEAKHYRKFDAAEFIRGNKGCALFIFWRQAVRSARLSGRFPVLIVKPNFFDELLILEKSVAESLLHVMRKVPRCLYIGGKLIMLRLRDFFEYTDRVLFLQAISDMEVRLGTHPDN